MNPLLSVQNIVDVYIRQNFQNLVNYFAAQNQLLNFVFKELNFTSSQTNYNVAHGLSVIPQDIIVTKLTGPGKVTFLHGKFDTTNMYLNVSDACRIRFFYGTYYNFTSNVSNQPTDQTTYSNGS